MSVQIAAFRRGHAEVVKLLLENGADVMVTDHNGWTPLYLAASSGYIEVVKLLLANGADVTVASSNGWTPLISAANSGHLEVVELLLKKGSLADVVDDYGRSAFFYACTRGHMEVVEHLSSHNVAPTNTDRYGATPLFAATRNGHEKVVAYLLTMGCDYGSFFDGLGRTLLWWASKSGNAQVIEAVLQLTKSEGIQVCDEDLAVEPRATPVGESSAWCNCCTRYMLEDGTHYHCATCQGDDVDLCGECVQMGTQCHDASHELVLRQTLWRRLVGPWLT